MKKEFWSVIIDNDNGTFTILDGSDGVYDLNNIKKARVAYEIASFRGKTDPFVHQFLGGASFNTAILEPKIYVGIKITTNDGAVKAIYVSEKPVLYHSDLYFQDEKTANKILEELK